MEIFAHRGVSALFPENSQSAITACHEQPYAGIEVDVFQIEQEFFILHDRWLTRLFGINKHVSEMTASEMTALTCKDGLPIPTLEWLFQQLSHNQLTLNLELKKITKINEFIATLTTLCQKYQIAQQRILLSSFNHHYLQQVHQQQPSFKLGLLISAHPVDISRFVNDFTLYSVHIDIDCLSEQLISDIQKLQLKVFVFTVDHQSELLWLQQLKVDAVFANNPLQAYNFINVKTNI